MWTVPSSIGSNSVPLLLPRRMEESPPKELLTEEASSDMSPSENSANGAATAAGGVFVSVGAVGCVISSKRCISLRTALGMRPRASLVATSVREDSLLPPPTFVASDALGGNAVCKPAGSTGSSASIHGELSSSTSPTMAPAIALTPL